MKNEAKMYGTYLCKHSTLFFLRINYKNKFRNDRYGSQKNTTDVSKLFENKFNVSTDKIIFKDFTSVFRIISRF